MKTVWIINQYASTPEEGMGGRSYYLAQELANIGYRVYLIASSSNHLLRKKKAVLEAFTLSKEGSFYFVWVKMPNYGLAHSRQRVFNWFLFPWRIQKLCEIIPHQPDAVLCSSPSLISFLGARRLAKIFDARLIFEVRDIWPLTLTEIGTYSRKHPFIRFMQWVEDVAYRDSDAVVSNLKNAVEHMVGRGMPADKFTWIPNGFCRNELEASESVDIKVLDLIPSDNFVVGYVGTFGLANDLYTLLDAAEKLKENRGISFVLVGGGQEKQRLINHSKELGLNSVVFIDFIEKKQVQSILKNFDVLVVGAKKEPMYRFGVSPNKLFDYLVAGKPIIYHIESGAYQPIKDASCGIEVESENPDQLARAIVHLYNLPSGEREEMGVNGRKAAFEQYDYANLATSLARVLFV